MKRDRHSSYGAKKLRLTLEHFFLLLLFKRLQWESIYTAHDACSGRNFILTPGGVGGGVCLTADALLVKVRLGILHDSTSILAIQLKTIEAKKYRQLIHANYRTSFNIRRPLFRNGDISLWKNQLSQRTSFNSSAEKKNFIESRRGTIKMTKKGKNRAITEDLTAHRTPRPQAWTSV